MELLVDTNSSFSWCSHSISADASCVMASMRLMPGGMFHSASVVLRFKGNLRMMRTAVIRVFVFDKPVPNPITNWDLFVGYIQAVLDVGAVPMVTFAKYPPPYDNPRHLRTFIARCSDIVYGCIDQWGGRIVCDWMWCIWNEPNNLPVGRTLSFLD
jgi:hypothetical protein